MLSRSYEKIMPHMHLDKEKMAALGLRSNSIAVSGGVMRYTVGVVQRERERLANIFIASGMANVAALILDTSKDDLVFKWVGPETPLETPPVPAPPRAPVVPPEEEQAQTDQ